MREEVSLTPEEVAGILKIAKNTVYEIIKRGELPAYRIGRKLRVDPKDVEIYRKQGKSFEFSTPDIPLERTAHTSRTSNTEVGTLENFSKGLIICGQDPLLDILSRHLESKINQIRAFRYHIGSFTGLSALYHDKADVVAVHLWDGDSGEYNMPFVRHLLPGIPVLIVHLAIRMQGFYVLRGNPVGINSWQDLARPDIRLVNREKGSGTRVLLDEHLRLLRIDSRLIKGYEREEHSHLAVASAVVRGEADVALGIEKASLQVRGIDFVPIQKERYELAIKKDNIDKPQIQAVLAILRSPEFQTEIEGLGDYDLAETGKIVLEP